MQKFNNKEEAFNWMFNEAVAGEDCIDNDRFAFQDDEEAMNIYENIRSNGCCGFFDEEIMVDNRLATIGCNFGH